ncbi:MAG: helicase-related protein [Opitutales bacterium]
MKNFISNESDNTLNKRLREVIGLSAELKFLVGFFYFSGVRELFEAIRDNSELKINILVGLQADRSLGVLVEHGRDRNASDNEAAEQFFTSLRQAMNGEEFDTQAFLEQVNFFLDLIREDRLEIRKTLDPNHAKLYLFNLKEEHRLLRERLFITGSSNLTQAGLLSQREFNVEITDYGTQEAEAFFDLLWEDAVEITADDALKSRLLQIFREETLVAEITPYEAYALVLQKYAQLQAEKEVPKSAVETLVDVGYTPFTYQLDATRQTLSILEMHNGAIIADVVGLGKSIIASLAAKSLGRRGLIICPPGLIGDKNSNSGWRKYVEDFRLERWEVRSCGDLESIAEFVSDQGRDVEVVVIDEAHRFRNQDSKNYELLSRICRNRKVLLLTATPFNNSPGDIFALLKLFTIPGKSTLTLSDDLDQRFAEYRGIFRRLSYIKKNHASRDPAKRDRAASYYAALFDAPSIDLKKVEQRTRRLSREIRAVIEPVTIRRNRIDLRRDPHYKDEIAALSTIAGPEELFYELSSVQSAFYNKVIHDYFGEDGRFCGAIYQPYRYESGADDSESLNEKDNFAFQQQRNLFEFMRRLLVKRFESSFAAFECSIASFLRINRKALGFIEKTGRYILDRKLLNELSEKDETEILEELERFEARFEQEGAEPGRKEVVYKIDDFAMKERFLEDIKADIALFESIEKEISELGLLAEDPKATELIGSLQQTLQASPACGEPKRKVIVFSEYVDTVRELAAVLEAAFPGRIFTVPGQLGAEKEKEMLANFDASLPIKRQADDYDILLASDKISEGFNLNRAGLIINYDIPWNPTRVIQRVGRINRIGKKVFAELRIQNFFPTEKGADIVKSRQIAADKMFMIHNTLGEDARIFSPDETPSASSLYNKINSNPEDNASESSFTEIRRMLAEIESEHPEVLEKVSKCAPRVKTAKSADNDWLTVFTLKGRDLFAQGRADAGAVPAEISIEEAIELIRCEYEAPRIPFSEAFWQDYAAVRDFRKKHNLTPKQNSVEAQALNTINAFLRTPEMAALHNFLKTLREDMTEYKTLPSNTLRRIADIGGKLEKAQKELTQLRAELGPDYLQQLKDRIGALNEEVIIAVENQKGAST